MCSAYNKKSHTSHYSSVANVIKNTECYLKLFYALKSNSCYVNVK
ncbi:hypothetical protein MY1_1363 [Nitrosarchaeum koreense MY1]|uniref:Uncharacterized protein n=1 Tax=Nitrosarchaeum koreense MY1 TaxID=1001994 RepID=F9CYF7_9ARCH|nr:hypothetical protein MY1_1363 [Nitrosarchaeum koreense MY1]